MSCNEILPGGFAKTKPPPGPGALETSPACDNVVMTLRTAGTGRFLEAAISLAPRYVGGFRSDCSARLLSAAIAVCDIFP